MIRSMRADAFARLQLTVDHMRRERVRERKETREKGDSH